MNTHTINNQSPDGDLLLESTTRRTRVRRRAAAALTPGSDHAAAPEAVSMIDRPDATRRVSGVGGARILRRWSVTDLIARAGGAPRAFA